MESGNATLIQPKIVKFVTALHERAKRNFLSGRSNKRAIIRNTNVASRGIRKTTEKMTEKLIASNEVVFVIMPLADPLA